MESTQRSPGLRPRTRGSHPEGKLGGNLTGAGTDLWLCLLSPPAAALRWSVIVFIIPCLAARLAWQQSRGAVFSGARSGAVRRGRCPHRPVSWLRRSSRADEDIGPYARGSRSFVGAAISRPPLTRRLSCGRIISAPTHGTERAPENTVPRDCCQARRAAKQGKQKAHTNHRRAAAGGGRSTTTSLHPRRPSLRQASLPNGSSGSGPAGPANFGYFPSRESNPPAGGTTPVPSPAGETPPVS